MRKQYLVHGDLPRKGDRRITQLVHRRASTLNYVQLTADVARTIAKNYDTRHTAGRQRQYVAGRALSARFGACYDQGSVFMAGKKKTHTHYLEMMGPLSPTKESVGVAVDRLTNSVPVRLSSSSGELPGVYCSQVFSRVRIFLGLKGIIEASSGCAKEMSSKSFFE